jgi:hypothetical protein
MVASWCRWAASLAVVHRVSGAGRRFSTCNRILHARALVGVQAELASCDALMRADPDSAVRKAYAVAGHRDPNARREAGILGNGEVDGAAPQSGAVITRRASNIGRQIEPDTVDH